MLASLRDKLADFDDNLPLERARTIPSQWYFDQEIHAAECQRIFAGTWQAVGRAEQVAQPGSFLTAEVAGEPILVVRDDKGALRAFHNVCRHKAAKVINQPEGKVAKLRCRYHGWTYDLTGRLRGTPEFDGVLDFAKDQQGLIPMAVDTWGPLVFIHQFSPSPLAGEGGTGSPSPLAGEGGVRGTPALQTLADFLAPLPEYTAAMGLEKLHFVGQREYEIDCNWKVFVDNYQDGGYHVNTVHPGLAGALDYANYRTENYANSSVQISPIKPSDDPTVGKVRAGDFAYYWWIFPNLMINLYQGVMDTNLVLPLGTDRCRVLFDFYFADKEGPAAQKFIADSIAVAHQVQLEDLEVCREVQRGLRSHSYSTGRFSVKRESGAYHFHQLLACKLREQTAV